MDNSMYEIYKAYSEDEESEIFPPATAGQIQNWERLHNAVLPEEYREFLLLSDGLRSFFGELFSLAEIKEFYGETKNYFIIGSYIGDGSMLLCDSDGNFYEFDHDYGIEESDLLSFLEFWYENK